MMSESVTPPEDSSALAETQNESKQPQSAFDPTTLPSVAETVLYPTYMLLEVNLGTQPDGISSADVLNKAREFLSEGDAEVAGDVVLLSGEDFSGDSKKKAKAKPKPKAKGKDAQAAVGDAEEVEPLDEGVPNKIGAWVTNALEERAAALKEHREEARDALIQEMTLAFEAEKQKALRAEAAAAAKEKEEADAKERAQSASKNRRATKKLKTPAEKQAEEKKRQEDEEAAAKAELQLQTEEKYLADLLRRIESFKEQTASTPSRAPLHVYLCSLVRSPADAVVLSQGGIVIQGVLNMSMRSPSEQDIKEQARLAEETRLKAESLLQIETMASEVAQIWEEQQEEFEAAQAGDSKDKKAKGKPKKDNPKSKGKEKDKKKDKGGKGKDKPLTGVLEPTPAAVVQEIVQFARDQGFGADNLFKDLHVFRAEAAVNAEMPDSASASGSRPNSAHDKKASKKPDKEAKKGKGKASDEAQVALERTVAPLCSCLVDSSRTFSSSVDAFEKWRSGDGVTTVDIPIASNEEPEMRLYRHLLADVPDLCMTSAVVLDAMVEQVVASAMDADEEAATVERADNANGNSASAGKVGRTSENIVDDVLSDVLGDTSEAADQIAQAAPLRSGPVIISAGNDFETRKALQRLKEHAKHHSSESSHLVTATGVGFEPLVKSSKSTWTVPLPVERSVNLSTEVFMSDVRLPAPLSDAERGMALTALINSSSMVKEVARVIAKASGVTDSSQALISPAMLDALKRALVCLGMQDLLDEMRATHYLTARLDEEAVKADRDTLRDWRIGDRSFQEPMSRPELAQTLSNCLRDGVARLGTRFLPLLDCLLVAVHVHTPLRRKDTQSWDQLIVSNMRLSRWLREPDYVRAVPPTRLYTLNGRHTGRLQGRRELLFPSDGSLIVQNVVALGDNDQEPAGEVSAEMQSPVAVTPVSLCTEGHWLHLGWVPHVPATSSSVERFKEAEVETKQTEPEEAIADPPERDVPPATPTASVSGSRPATAKSKKGSKAAAQEEKKAEEEPEAEEAQSAEEIVATETDPELGMETTRVVYADDVSVSLVGGAQLSGDADTPAIPLRAECTTTGGRTSVWADCSVVQEGDNDVLRTVRLTFTSDARSFPNQAAADQGTTVAETGSWRVAVEKQFADGTKTVLYDNGAVEEIADSGDIQRTAADGSRSSHTDSADTELPALNSVTQLDPETRAVVQTREDFVMTVSYADGSSLAQHSDGTRIFTDVFRGGASKATSQASQAKDVRLPPLPSADELGADALLKGELMLRVVVEAPGFAPVCHFMRCGPGYRHEAAKPPVCACSVDITPADVSSMLRVRRFFNGSIHLTRPVATAASPSTAGPAPLVLDDGFGNVAVVRQELLKTLTASAAEDHDRADTFSLQAIVAGKIVPDRVSAGVFLISRSVTPLPAASVSATLRNTDLEDNTFTASLKGEASVVLLRQKGVDVGKREDRAEPIKEETQPMEPKLSGDEEPADDATASNAEDETAEDANNDAVSEEKVGKGNEDPQDVEEAATFDFIPSQYFPLPNKPILPRLFVVHRDGTGYELLSEEDVRECVKACESDPLSVVLPDEKQEYGDGGADISSGLDELEDPHDIEVGRAVAETLSVKVMRSLAVPAPYTRFPIVPNVVRASPHVFAQDPKIFADLDQGAASDEDSEEMTGAGQSFLLLRHFVRTGPVPDSLLELARSDLVAHAASDAALRQADEESAPELKVQSDGAEDVVNEDNSEEAEEKQMQEALKIARERRRKEKENLESQQRAARRAAAKQQAADARERRQKVAEAEKATHKAQQPVAPAVPMQKPPSFFTSDTRDDAHGMIFRSPSGPYRAKLTHIARKAGDSRADAASPSAAHTYFGSSGDQSHVRSQPFEVEKALTAMVTRAVPRHDNQAVTPKQKPAGQPSRAFLATEEIHQALDCLEPLLSKLRWIVKDRGVRSEDKFIELRNEPYRSLLGMQAPGHVSDHSEELLTALGLHPVKADTWAIASTEGLAENLQVFGVFIDFLQRKLERDVDASARADFEQTTVGLPSVPARVSEQNSRRHVLEETAKQEIEEAEAELRSKRLDGDPPLPPAESMRPPDYQKREKRLQRAVAQGKPVHERGGRTFKNKRTFAAYGSADHAPISTVHGHVLADQLAPLSAELPPAQYDVTGKVRSKPVQLELAKSLRPGSTAVLNAEYIAHEDPTTRAMRTVATLKEVNEVGAGLSDLRVKPHRITLGTIKPDTTYRVTMAVMNVGAVKGRFLLHAPQQQDNQAFLRVLYRPGPVAPGMQKLVELELYTGSGEYELNTTVQLDTERFVYHVPISATVSHVPPPEENSLAALRSTRLSKPSASSKSSTGVLPGSSNLRKSLHADKSSSKTGKTVKGQSFGTLGKARQFCAGPSPAAQHFAKALTTSRSPRQEVVNNGTVDLHTSTNSRWQGDTTNSAVSPRIPSLQEDWKRDPLLVGGSSIMNTKDEERLVADARAQGLKQSDDAENADGNFFDANTSGGDYYAPLPNATEAELGAADRAAEARMLDSIRRMNSGNVQVQ